MIASLSSIKIHDSVLQFFTTSFVGPPFHGEQQHFVGGQLGVGPLERGRERVVGEVRSDVGGRRISERTFQTEWTLKTKWTFKTQRSKQISVV